MRSPVQKIAEIFHKDEPRSQIKLFRVNACFIRSFLSKETLRIMYPARVYLRSKGTTVGRDLITVKKTNSELDFTQKRTLSFQWDDPPY